MKKQLDMNHMLPTYDLNILKWESLISPDEIKKVVSVSEKAIETIIESRSRIEKILTRKDKRIMIIVGPCSIHDEKSAYEYADKLLAIREKVKDKLEIIMRVYFEKPRTIIGWKGLVYDPNLDGSYDIQKGLIKGRRILVNILERGLPTATELLDPIVPQYIADLISWAAIGARTSESQTHRQMSSGLSMPIGFKNNTDGNMQIAIDALRSAKESHSFLGLDPDGKACVVKTKGNSYGHIILRGGKNFTNFDSKSINEAVEKLKEVKINKGIVIDCSHANSEKKYEKQEIVFNEVINQVNKGNNNIAGLMLESHLFEGNQKLIEDLTQLKYGVSITDACINIETTEKLLMNAYRSLL